jgi:hypothetical protein
MDKTKDDVLAHEEGEKLGIPRQPVFADGIDTNTLDPNYNKKPNRNSLLVRKISLLFWCTIFICAAILFLWWLLF